MQTYAALLRGINVGGKNLIKMVELATFFRAMGFSEVRTYIQSGNVIFGSNEPGAAKLTRLLEEALSKTFDYKARVVVRSHAEMKGIVKKAPKGFGGQPELYRYDVIFLKEPLTAAEAKKGVTARPGVDTVNVGKGVLYTSRLIERAAQSYLTRMIGLPIYQDMTIRNWNTTLKLLGMMEEIEG